MATEVKQEELDVYFLVEEGHYFGVDFSSLSLDRAEGTRL